MEAYKHINVASYVHAYYLAQADDEQLQRDIDFFKAYIPLKKVYLENHRGVVDITPQRLREIRAIFERNGIAASVVAYAVIVSVLVGNANAATLGIANAVAVVIGMSGALGAAASRKDKHGEGEQCKGENEYNWSFHFSTSILYIVYTILTYRHRFFKW